MKETKRYLPWVGFITVLAGGISCVGAEYMGKDLYSVQDAVFPPLGKTSRSEMSNLGPVSLTASLQPEPNFSAMSTSSIAPNREYELLQHIVCESLPTISPADGPVTSKFGYRYSPFSKVKKGLKAGRGKKRKKIKSFFHKGIDIAAEDGSYVVASGNGRVLAAGYDAGYGHFVDIDHGRGIVSRYAHAKAILVREGDMVMGGHRIAIVGSSGHATGPHLHFEVLRKGKQVDPERYLITGIVARSYAVSAVRPKVRSAGLSRRI
jgi:murein DD-endopeptidase MepM/ murein hydrolase activator NlpD